VGIRRWLAVLGTGALLGGGLVVASSSPIGALTVLTVTNNSDAAANGLRAQIIVANATADNVQIDVQAGLGTITLTTGELLYTGGVGGTHALTINGNGVTVNQTTVGARVFHSTSTGLITLNGMTISGGNLTAAPAPGAAVLTASALTMNNDTVRNNTATSAVVGVSNESSIIAAGSSPFFPATLSNVTVDTNTTTGVNASTGGTLIADAATITNSRFTNNTDTASGANGFADGIIDSNVTTITNSTFAGNTNSTSGSRFAEGILFTTTTTITGSTFTNNTNTSTGGGRPLGVLDVDAVTITDTTITGNINSAVGGNAGAEGVLDSGAVTLTRVTMTGNTNSAVGSGSAFGVVDSGDATVVSSTVDGNTAVAVSGPAFGIFDSGDSTITDSSVSGNHVTSTSNDAFGAVLTSGLTVTRSTVANNVTMTAGAAKGGAIVTADNLITITNSSIVGNRAIGATSNGGGIDHAGSVGTLSFEAPPARPGKHEDAPRASKSDVGPQQGPTVVELVYSTVVGNTAANGANVRADGLESFGSVVALPTSGANCVLAHPTVSSGYNFSDDASCGFTGTGDRVSAGDPLLGALADNGGPAPTRLPLIGSPLIDAIPLAACPDGASGITTDERGVIRPQRNRCDIGAVEVVAAVLGTPRLTG
jgi:hypothetical protein